MGSGPLVAPHWTGDKVAGRKRAELIATGVPAQLALRLRAARDDSRLTLRQLAAKSGFSQSALSVAEAGRAVPSWDLISAFVTACGQDPERWRQLWEVARDAQQQSADSPRPDLAEPEPMNHVSDASAADGAPDPTPRRSRPLIILLAAVATAAVVAAVAVPLTLASNGAHAAPPAGRSKAAQDRTDPYDDHCNADEKQLDWKPVLRSDGSNFGTIVLMYSAACQAAWGYLDAPNTSAWTSHIVAHRIPGNDTAPSQFKGDAAYGSWGNVLSTQNGCVYIEACVVESTGEGAHAKTACFQPTEPTVSR